MTQQKSAFDRTLSLVLGDKSHSSYNFLKTDGGQGVPPSIFESYQTSHDQASGLTVIQPAQAPSETVYASSNSYTEFLFQPYKSRITQILLDWIVKSPSTTVPATGYDLLDRIEYYSGSTLIGSVDASSLWAIHGLTRTPAEHEAMRAATNQGENYNGSNALSAANERQFSIDITGPLSSLVTSFVREQIRIRVYYRIETEWSFAEAVTGTYTVVNGQLLKSIRLIVESVSLPSDEEGVVKSVYASNRLTHRFIEPRVVRHQMTIGDSGSYNISLSGLHGAHAAIIVSCRYVLNNKPLHNDAFEKVWITDSNGAIVNSVPFENKTLNTISAGSFAGPFLAKAVAGRWAPLLFSKNVNSDLLSGSCNGSLILRSQGESLNFVSKNQALTTPINVEVVITGYHFSAYRVVDSALVSLR